MTTPDQPTPACCSAVYPSKSRDPNTRIVHCELPAGHAGDHEEVSTESSWPSCCPGESLRGDPFGMHTHDCPFYLANIEAWEAQRGPVTPQPWPPQLPRPLTQADADERERLAYERGKAEGYDACADELNDKALRAIKAAFRDGRHLGLREATEGWEREWGVDLHGRGGHCVMDEHAARGIAAECRDRLDHLEPKVLSRLVDPWEPADQPEPAREEADRG